MAIPERPEGYIFDPKPSPSTDEVMSCLKVIIKLITDNQMMCVAPRREVEDLPEAVKRHFKKIKL